MKNFEMKEKGEIIEDVLGRRRRDMITGVQGQQKIFRGNRGRTYRRFSGERERGT